MKLKMSGQNELFRSEEMFLFVDFEDIRLPIRVGKDWTIGRCIHSMLKVLAVSSQSDTNIAEVFQVYRADWGQAVEAADIVSSYFHDMDTGSNQEIQLVK
uniref:Transposase n=1 Tax=Heterorhabditis bacteriophora TaxID=37862 RepID=A0A1I7X979_HETBA